MRSRFAGPVLDLIAGPNGSGSVRETCGQAPASLGDLDPALPFEAIRERGQFHGRLRLSPRIVVAVHARNIVAAQGKGND